MFAARSGNAQGGLLLLTVFAALMAPGSGYAYTPEQQQACTGDAFRLCNSEIPDVDRVTACMVRNKSQLSPGCRVFFRPGPEPGDGAAAGAPTNIKPVSAHKKPSAKTKKHKKTGKSAET